MPRGLYIGGKIVWVDLPAINLTQDTTQSIDLSTYLHNPRNRAATYSAVGGLPTGCSISGASLNWNGAGIPSVSQITVRAVSNQYQADATTSVTIVSGEPTGNEDWLSRANATGVIWATNFATEADVDNWRYTNENSQEWDPDSVESHSAKVAWRPNEGVIGTNALRIEDTEVSDSPVVWWRTLDNTKSSGDRTASYVVAPGTAIYLQARIKVNALRMDNTSGSGLKMAEITSAVSTNVNQECFIARVDGRPYPQIVGATSTQSDPWNYVDLGGGDFDMQPGSAYGQCLYSEGPTGTGCWIIPPDEYVTYHLKLIGGTAGGQNTVVKLEVALSGDSSYTTIYDRTDNYMPAPYEDGNGYSAIALFNRNEDHTGLPAGCYHYFTEVIASLNPIACPTPITVPSWFTGATEKRWTAVPGTADATLLDAYGSLPSNFLSYSGATVDQDSRSLLMVGNGGHGDYYGNEAYRLDLTQETCAWERVNTPSTATGGDNSSNGYGTYADGSKRADHTYNHQICTAPNTVYFPCLGAMADSVGPPSTACWKWREADLANGENGYTYLGKAHEGASLPSGLSMVNSCSAYDRDSGLVWFVSQNAFQAPNGVWSIDTATDTITTYAGYDGYVEFPVWCAIIPHLNCLLVGTASNTLKRMDLTTKAWTSITSSGTGVTSVYYHAAYYEPGRQVFGWQEDGSSVRCLTVPDTVGGTWAWATKTAVSGGVTLSGTSGDEAGTHSRFNVITNMGNGQGCIIYQPGRDTPCYFYKLPPVAI